MVDALDNCDDPVIHIGNSNEAPMVDSDNVRENLLSIFRLTSHHQHFITGHSVLIVI